MALTPAQATAFKAAILANASLATARTAGDHGTIAAYYNASAGAGTIWRPIILVPELNTAVVWSEFIALPVQTQNAYFALIQGGSVDATNANVRAGFSSIFTGLTTLTNLTTLASRVPTRFEALFTTANVCTCFNQQIAVSDVILALGS